MNEDEAKRLNADFRGRFPDPRTIRLYDLRPDQDVFVRCPCGRVVQYQYGVLQKKHRLPSDMLVYDLRWRLRCECGRWRGLGVEITGAANAGGNSTERIEVAPLEK